MNRPGVGQNGRRFLLPSALASVCQAGLGVPPLSFNDRFGAPPKRDVDALRRKADAA